MSLRVIRAETQLRTEVRDQSDIGECRRIASRLAQTHGFDEDGVGKISIIATELATNLVRHGGGGEMLLQVLDDEITPQFEIMAIDRGPGMRDVADCLRDGYSTAGTAGTGLGATSRLSTEFDLFSEPGKGTIVLSRVARRRNSDSPPVSRSGPATGFAPLEIGAVCIPLAGETECGDGWRVADDGQTVAMLVVDGLGHGPLAATAARSAAQAFEEGPIEEPVSVMQSLDRRLFGSRGAVGACARLRAPEGKLHYAGVGNISGIIIEPHRSRGMVSLNGTLGLQSPRGRQFDYEYSEDSVVVMHSDGLSARWHLADYPGLCSKHAAVIAGVLFRDHARKRDDATVLVARHRS
jgi:anti-sigma regulatory factor (Ser/Thr protein kinase)